MTIKVMRHRCQRPSVVVKRLARRFAFGRYWVQIPVPPDLVLWVFFKSFPHTHLDMSTQATPGSVYSPLSTYHPPHRTHPVSVAEKALESPPSGEMKDASFPGANGRGPPATHPNLNRYQCCFTFRYFLVFLP
jgi:hypothetical protein